MTSGFHQIKLNEKDTEKTAFSTPGNHYQYKRLPFGLATAPATFQRLMNNTLYQKSASFIWTTQLFTARRWTNTLLILNHYSLGWKSTI